MWGHFVITSLTLLRLIDFLLLYLRASLQYFLEQILPFIFIEKVQIAN